MEARTSIPLTDQERAARHFGVAPSGVTAQMIEQLPPHGTGLASQPYPIGQVLNSVAERLEKTTRDPKIGADLSSQVQQFNKSYSKVLGQMRQCQNVNKNLDVIVTAMIPLGKKLASDVWDTLERMGLWSAETEDASDLLTQTLITNRFIDDSLDAITMGCECRRKSN